MYFSMIIQTLQVNTLRPTAICIGKIGHHWFWQSLLPDLHEAIIWTNANFLSIEHIGTYLNQILIKIQQFLSKEINLTLLSAKKADFVLASMCYYGCGPHSSEPPLSAGHQNSRSQCSTLRCDWQGGNPAEWMAEGSYPLSCWISSGKQKYICISFHVFSLRSHSWLKDMVDKQTQLILILTNCNITLMG